MSTTEDHKGEFQVYELGYLVLSSIAEDSLPQVVTSIKEIINKAGGKELDGEAPIKHDLAYPMSKVVGSSKYVVNDAYLGWQKFQAEPSNVEAIKGEVEKVSEILRFILIKVPLETTFTFAKAREAMEEKERAESAPVEKTTEDVADVVPEVASEEDVVE
jgi:ribosomal protein S6